MRWLVRRRVRHREHGRGPTECRSARPRLDRLGLFATRLAQVRVEVDQSGSDDAPADVDDARGVEPVADRDDPTVGDEDVAAGASRPERPGPVEALDAEIGERSEDHAPSPPSIGNFAFFQACQLPGMLHTHWKPSCFKMLVPMLAR